MKNIILFLLFPLFSFGQNDVTSDSSYLKWENNAWYRVTSQTFSNGDIRLLQTFIGDTSTLYNQTVDGIRNSTVGMATDAAYTSGFAKTVRDLVRQSDEVLAKAGKSPVDSIENTDASVFLASGWTVKNGGSEVAIVFNQTAAKKLRYQYTTTTNRQVDLLGAVIRLRDFPTSGITTDFYRLPNGKRWVTLDRSYQLIPPGGNAANRQ